MEREGPRLESITRRLGETPEDFLSPPRIGGKGRVHVGAVAGDLLRTLGVDASAAELESFTTGLQSLTTGDPPRDQNRLAVTLLLCWLLSDEWFRGVALGREELLELLGKDAAGLGAQTPSRKFVADPDRREELARFALSRLGFRPEGETVAQAQDRLTSLSATERARVMKAAKTAEQRARKLREALVAKAAAESADKWTRE